MKKLNGKSAADVGNQWPKADVFYESSKPKAKDLHEWIKNLKIKNGSWKSASDWKLAESSKPKVDVFWGSWKPKARGGKNQKSKMEV